VALPQPLRPHGPPFDNLQGTDRPPRAKPSRDGGVDSSLCGHVRQWPDNLGRLAVITTTTLLLLIVMTAATLGVLANAIRHFGWAYLKHRFVGRGGLIGLLSANDERDAR
jgi:hypothetical protein